MSPTFDIIDYQDCHKPALMDISLPWLEENDLLEPADIQQLEHPELVLESGGCILLARVGEEIVGMMMLECFGDGVAEPFKYGVKPAHRGKGIGTALMEATIAAARARGVHKLVLTSHHSLSAALRLYEQFGFRHEVHDNVAFQLSDVSMVKDL